MRLPISVVVLIAVVVIVLVVAVVLFTSMGGQQMSIAQAEKVVAERCMSLCPQVKAKLAGDVEEFIVSLKSDGEFIIACKSKYGTDVPNECLRNCPGDCSYTKSRIDELMKTSYMPGNKQFTTEIRDKYVAEIPKYTNLPAVG